MSKKQLKFSAADRRKIAALVIGTPSGTVVEIGGMEFDLLPLTTRQADRVFELLDTITGLQRQAEDDGAADITQTALMELVAREGKNVSALVHDVLLKSARAMDILDDEAVFDEWFDQLELKDTILTLLPKLVAANGLSTMLGNSSTPTAAAPATGSETAPKSHLTSVS